MISLVKTPRLAPPLPPFAHAVRRVFIINRAAPLLIARLVPHRFFIPASYASAKPSPSKLKLKFHWRTCSTRGSTRLSIELKKKERKKKQKKKPSEFAARFVKPIMALGLKSFRPANCFIWHFIYRLVWKLGNA